MEMKMSDKEYKYKARKIGKLMAEFSEWENTAKNSRHVEKLYGVQKYYKKKADNDNKECDTVWTLSDFVNRRFFVVHKRTNEQTNEKVNQTNRVYKVVYG